MEMKRMRKKSVLAKLLSLVLCMAMVGSICAPLVAAEEGAAEGAVGEAEVIYGEATLVGGGDGGSDTQYADAMEVTALFEQMMRMTDPNELANAIASLTEVQRQLLGEELLRQLEARLYALKVAVNAPILPAPETPAESGTPAGNETPTVPETPAEEETPAGNETPTVPEAPAEEETPSAGDELYARLSAITDPAALLLAADALTEEEVASLSEEQRAALIERLDAAEAELAQTEETYEPMPPTVNYTWVAPFGAPVAGAPSRKLFSRMFSNYSLRSSEAPSTYGNDGASASTGLELSKTVTADPTGGYTVRLEAYATGETVTTTVTEDVPTDIVLVLDQSGSMEFCIVCGKEDSSTHTVYNATTQINPGDTYYIQNDSGYRRVYYCDGSHDRWNCSGGPGWYTSTRFRDHTSANKKTPKTSNDPDGTQFYVATSEKCTRRLAALKTAVTNFANSVATKAKGADGALGTGDDVNHRIAVVGFASESGYGNNTELLSISGSNSGSVGVAYKNINNRNLIAVLQDMNSTDGQTMVTNAINALAAEGATQTNLGVDMAQRILTANPVPTGEKRNRVVIVFTDGVPTTGRTFDDTVANNAISKADSLKSTGVTVYSIGIFDGADATSAGNSNGTDTQKANRFMQKLSNNNGTPQSPSYYLSAGDAGSLNSIFQQISNQIQSGGSATTLTETSVIKDIVTPYFKVPADAVVSLKVAPCTGKNGDTLTWGNEVAATGVSCKFDTIDEGKDKTLSVTGFSFKDNWCGLETTNGTSTPHGRKLIIEFHIVRDPKFLGGNNVPTNGAASGVYVDKDAADPVDTFDVPHVNEPIYDVTVEVVDKNVYLMDSVTIPQLVAQSTIKCGDITLYNEDGTPATADWQGAYVTITPNSGLTTGNLTADTTYNLTATVAPSSQAAAGTPGTAATAKSGTSNTANIRVFKPVITFKDSFQPLNSKVDNYGGNRVGVTWKHGGTLDTAVTMTGVNYAANKSAPVLTYTYDPAAIEKLQADTPVAVTVMYGAEDVTGYTTFEHETCSLGSKCIHNAETDQFVVHVNREGLWELSPDASFIRVSKTFVGITRDQIPVGFAITASSGGTSYTLRCSESDPYFESVSEDGLTWTWKITGAAAGTYTVTENGYALDDYDVAGSSGGTAFNPATGTSADLTERVFTVTNDDVIESCNNQVFNVGDKDGTTFLFAARVNTNPKQIAVISAEPLSVSQRKSVESAIRALGGNWHDAVMFYSLQSDGVQNPDGTVDFVLAGATLTYAKDATTGAETVTIHATKEWTQAAGLSFSITEGNNPDIGITNTYTLKTGKLTITKTFTAENAARLAYIESTLGNSFTITYDNGLTGQDQVKAELHPLTATGEDVWVKDYSNGGKTVTFTKTFEVKTGTYTVTEIVNDANTAEVAGFTLTATPTATATVEPRQTAAAALSNSYAIKTGTITVTKTLTGAVPVKATNYVFEITGTTVAGEAVKYYIPVEVPAGQTSASGSINYALYGTYTCTELTPTVGELQSIAGGPLTLNAANPSIGFAATNSFTNHVEYDTDVVNNRFTYENSSWSWKRVVGD